MLARESTFQLPLSYREREVRLITSCILAGESCSVVGLASAGKSNLFRFLLRDDVQEAYLGTAARETLLILLDSHSLSMGGISEWAVYELALHRMLREVDTLSIGTDKLMYFDELYAKAIQSRDVLLAHRYLERFLASVCGQHQFHVVFLFDEFDEIAQHFQRHFFLNLRSFRDQFKYQVSYVVATRNLLSRVRENILEIEAFYELLSLNVIGLGPYNEADANFMIRRLAARRGENIESDAANLLVQVTGGHPGILKAAFWTMDKWMSKVGNIVEHLLDNAKVWEECLKVWDSLEEDERNGLAILATDSMPPQFPQAILQLLDLKGLVKYEAGSPEIFSRLFKAFVNRQVVTVGRGVKTDIERAEVWVEGRRVNDLTPLEISLLSYLVDNQGRVCTRDELIEHLYPDEYKRETGIPDNRVDTLVGRVREKIEPNRSNPRYLVTVRGYGYKFTDG